MKPPGPRLGLESIIQEYLMAETFEKRRVIAIRAANIAWVLAKKSGRFPTDEFYDEFLEAAFQNEKNNFQLDELHHIKQHVERGRELELDQAKEHWGRKFIDRLRKTFNRRKK